MNSKRSIRTKVLGISSVIFLVLGVLGVYSWYGSSQIKESSTEINSNVFPALQFITTFSFTVEKMKPVIETLIEEPDEDEGFAPDGIYHPRILFGGTNGKVEATLHHKDEIYITDVEGDSREFYPDPVRMKYYYPDKASMINGMRRAMKFYGLR